MIKELNFTKICLAGIFIAFLLNKQFIHASQELEAQELIELVLATRQKYYSLDAEIRSSHFKLANGKLPAKPYAVSDVIWRWKQDGPRTFLISNRRDIEYKPNGEVLESNQSKRTYAITPKYSKSLDEIFGERTPRGIVTKGKEIEYTLEMTPDKAMWGLFYYKWEKLPENEIDATYYPDDDLYILKAKVSSSTSLIVKIDPSKDFLPIESKLVEDNGDLIFISKCSDFRKNKNGLWLPYKYDYGDNEYIARKEVKRAEINLSMPDELLDFSFPTGTRVRDRIANKKYITDEIFEGDSPMNNLDQIGQNETEHNDTFVRAKELQDNPETDKELAGKESHGFIDQNSKYSFGLAHYIIFTIIALIISLLGLWLVLTIRKKYRT